METISRYFSAASRRPDACTETVPQSVFCSSRRALSISSTIHIIRVRFRLFFLHSSVLWLVFRHFDPLQLIGLRRDLDIRNLRVETRRYSSPDAHTEEVIYFRPATGNKMAPQLAVDSGRLAGKTSLATHFSGTYKIRGHHKIARITGVPKLALDLPICLTCEI